MTYLGLDVGSLFVGLVLIDEEGRIAHRAYERHRGNPIECAGRLLAAAPLQDTRGLVLTGSGASALPGTYPTVDAIVAGVEGTRRLHPDARNIISIGGGSFSLTCLDENGRYRRSTINSACASGTGAFLEGQAARLQIPSDDLATRAMACGSCPPSVATRCAVFAKSDMIHLQQEGYGVDAIAAGLCTGLGHAIVDGLLNGRALEGKTALIGGVSLNAVVVRSVTAKLGVETVVPEHPELVGAYGAALEARHRCAGGAAGSIDLSALLRAACAPEAAPQDAFLRPPLELNLSSYPDFASHLRWVDDAGSEISLITPREGRVRVTMGIDIGSTSTKAALLDDARDVVGWVYRKTAGDPIRAVQHVFRAFRAMEARAGCSLDVRGVGTTGSGRKLIGELVGADLIVNEITAHAQAASFLDPQVDTIIELGGQDAKFTQLQNGMVYNSVMNYVCAAGTGSFIEEQALKLGIALDRYADAAMGVACPQTSDRCTVYMERDLDLLLARGWSREALAAAVLHSVRDNYLNKVVNGLLVGDHVCFQGATARNRALVAAFEQELGKPIRVSPFCHVTGALGMALLVADRVSEERRGGRFRGLGFADEPVLVEHETCEVCHNSCNLSIIRTPEDELAWGLKCGRDYHEKKLRVEAVPGLEAWRARERAWMKAPEGGHGKRGPKVGILRSLGTYGTYPFWNTFLHELGCQAVLGPSASSDTVGRGRQVTAAEYCAPVVASHGHALRMLEKGNVDFILVPHMIREPIAKGFHDSHYCGYVQAHPSVLKAVPSLDFENRMLSPIVQFNRDEAYQVDRLSEALCDPLGVGPDDIRRALRAGHRAMAAFQDEARRLGSDVIEGLEREGRLGIVCVGRPYNTVDPGLTLELPRKIAALGYPVLFMDMLPLDVRDILPEYDNMYWHYGQKILAAARYVSRHPRLFAVYFTNFMCGPDSYLLTYFKDLMGRQGKPYLCLQFDGHGADAGYLTRVEAALESFHTFSGVAAPDKPSEVRRGGRGRAPVCRAEALELVRE